VVQHTINKIKQKGKQPSRKGRKGESQLWWQKRKERPPRQSHGGKSKYEPKGRTRGGKKSTLGKKKTRGKRQGGGNSGAGVNTAAETAEII